LNTAAHQPLCDLSKHSRLTSFDFNKLITDEKREECSRKSLWQH
jgi:hypothetical protein